MDVRTVEITRSDAVTIAEGRVLNDAVRGNGERGERRETGGHGDSGGGEGIRRGITVILQNREVGLRHTAGNEADAIAAADDRLFVYPVSDAEAGAVVIVRVSDVDGDGPEAGEFEGIVGRVVVRVAAGEAGPTAAFAFKSEADIEGELGGKLPFILDVEVRDELATGRENEGEVAAALARDIEQESAKGVGEVAAGIGYGTGLGGAVIEAAAGVEGLGLEEIVAFATEVGTEADDMFSEGFREVVDDAKGGDGASPGQAGGEANEGGGVSVDVDLGEAVRPGVEVRSANADLFGGLQPGIGVESVVAVADDPDTGFPDQGGVQNFGVVHAGTLGAGGAGATEAATPEATVDSAGAEQARIIDERLLEAVADGQTVVAADDPIDFAVHLVEGFDANAVLGVVDLAFGEIQVRGGDKADDPTGDGADATLRDDVAGEGGTTVSGGVTGERVVDGGAAGREIARAEGGSGNITAVDLAEVVAAALVVAEEEEFVANDTPAEGAAELVVGGWRFGDGEGVAGLDVFVAMEVEEAAVEIIRAAAEGDVGDGAAGVTELGIEVGGGDVDGLDGFSGGHEGGQVAVVDFVFDAFDLEVIELAALAVHTDGERILRVVEFGVGAEGAADAGDEEQQALVVPVVEHRHGLELFGIDFAAGVGAVGLEEGCGGGANVDRLGDGTGGELEVDAGGGVREQVDAGAECFTEASLFRFDAIGAGVETDEEEVAGIVGIRGAAGVGLGFHDGNLDSWNDGTGLVGDHTENLALEHLGGKGSARETERG